jgi:hypothetical protein
MTDSQFNLAEIRQHPKFPFEAWQEDDVSFLMLELYWAELVREILGDKMQNYTPLWDTQRDGNPILTITNQTTLRGLRLVMIANEDNKPLYPEKTGTEAFYGLQPFTNIGRLPDGETQVYELVMLVSIDERFLDYFAYLVRLHCCDNVSMEQMDEANAIYEAKFGFADPPADLSED